jgi:hypothetical protein
VLTLRRHGLEYSSVRCRRQDGNHMLDPTMLRPESRSVNRESGFGERRRVSHRDEQWTGRKDVMIKSKPSEFHCTAPFNLKLKFSTGWFLAPMILANV